MGNTQGLAGWIQCCTRFVGTLPAAAGYLCQMSYAIGNNFLYLTHTSKIGKACE
jgi:hypothetical protein